MGGRPPNWSLSVGRAKFVISTLHQIGNQKKFVFSKLIWEFFDPGSLLFRPKLSFWNTLRKKETIRKVIFGLSLHLSWHGPAPPLLHFKLPSQKKTNLGRASSMLISNV